ncbi:hypothetical protein ES703_03936 [subsurface metagenome]
MKKKDIKNKEILIIFSNQKGMALLTTLIFVFILVTFAAALLTMTSNDSKLSTLQKESTRAFYLAETGIEKAIWYLNSSEENTDGLDFMGPLDGGTPTEEFYNVVFSYDPGPPEIKTLISTGKVIGGGEYNKGTRKIEVKLKKGISPSLGLSYVYGIFTNGDMTFHGDINISGNIHSNENINVSSTEVFDLENGTATASGINDVGDGNQPVQQFPEIDWEYFQGLAEEGINGGHYYDEETYIFNVPEILTGIHYIDGNVVISTDITLTNAAIFANGTITVLGNGDVTLGNDIEDHPLALIAKGDITIGGKVHGEGIIQTEGSFTNNGSVEINEGAIYAELGTFNGGGAVQFNVYYATELVDITVPGTGIPVWKKISWQEVY